MDLRIATPDDAPALAHLRWEWRAEEDGDAGGEPKQAFVERFVAFATAGFASGAWTAFVAEQDGELIATIWVERFAKVPRPGRPRRDLGYMTNVYTKPAFRGEGVGARLLEAVRGWAEESSLEEIIVWPAGGREPWYARAGYVPSTEIHELEIAGYDD